MGGGGGTEDLKRKGSADRICKGLIYINSLIVWISCSNYDHLCGMP